MALDAGVLVAKVRLDGKGFTSGVKGVTSQLSKAEKQALKNDKAFSSLTSSAKNLARSLGPALGVGALVLGFKKLTDAAGEFEKGMINVSTLVDTAVVDMDRLTEGLLEMSEGVIKSTSDLTSGLFQVISAGVDAADALDVLRIAAIAATAGVTDTGSSVKAITGILNAYGLEAKEATRISDLLFQTNKFGVTTFGELANSVGTVIPSAASLGIKLEDLFAAVATLTKANIDTATATTSLRAVFMSILKPADEATKTAKELGLEWTAAALSSKGLVQFINDMKEATKGNTEQMAKLIPESRALTAVLALAGKQANTFNKIQEEMFDSTGVTAEAFEKQADTFDAQAKRVAVAWENLKIKVGTPIIGAVSFVLETFIDQDPLENVRKEVTRLEEEIKKLKETGAEGLDKVLGIDRIPGLEKFLEEARTSLVQSQVRLRVQAFNQEIKEMEKRIAAEDELTEEVKEQFRVTTEGARDLAQAIDAATEARERLGVVFDTKLFLDPDEIVGPLREELERLQTIELTKLFTPKEEIVGPTLEEIQRLQAGELVRQILPPEEIVGPPEPLIGPEEPIVGPTEEQLEAMQNAFLLEQEQIEITRMLYQSLAEDINLSTEERLLAAEEVRNIEAENLAEMAADYELFIGDKALADQWLASQKTKLDKKLLKDTGKTEKTKLQIAQGVAGAMGSLLNSLAVLSGSNSKAMFEAQKAAATATAIVNTAGAANKTWEQWGMPWGIPFVAAVVAAGLAQVATIQSTSVGSSGGVSADTGGGAGGVTGGSVGGIATLPDVSFGEVGQPLTDLNRQAPVEINLTIDLLDPSGLDEIQAARIADALSESIQENLENNGAIS
jgi:TP901 family phage tail tape measure protein